MKPIGHLLAIIVFLNLPGLVACGGTTSRPTATLPVHSDTIAFSKLLNENGEEADIYSIKTDGTRLTELAHEPGATFWHPAWSPDGTKIAYQSVPGNYGTSTVWSMNTDGSGKIQLTQLPMSGLFPTWSPNGKQIAFSSFALDNQWLHLYIMNVDGSDIQPVTSGEMNDVFPAWAPDGKIFFLRDHPPSIYADVFAVNPDGSGLVQITTKVGIRGFTLSPDGKSLAVDDYLSRSIVKIPITPPGDEVVLIDEFYECDNMTLSWSPDGKAVALGCSPLDALTGPRPSTS